MEHRNETIETITSLYLGLIAIFHISIVAVLLWGLVKTCFQPITTVEVIEDDRIERVEQRTGPLFIGSVGTD